MGQNNQITQTAFWPLLSRRNVHFTLTAISIIVLLISLTNVNLPLKWDIKGFIGSYIYLAFSSVMLAALLYAINSPNYTLTLLGGLWRDKPKLIIIFLYSIVLFVALGPKNGTIALIDTIALLEITTRRRNHAWKAFHVPVILLPPAMYLFVGLIIAFTFSLVIVRVRYYGLYNNFFNSIDKIILGTSVSDIAHYAHEILPTQAIHALGFIYFSMFELIGATLIICGISSGSRQALQFVGTILVAYYIAIVLFLFFTSTSPFYTTTNHHNIQLLDPNTSTTQSSLITFIQHLWKQKPVIVNPVAYFIGFPSMHIAQPVIALWYLRKFKRIIPLLIAYDILLIASILILNWHYFVDILGGIVVAAVAVLLVGETFKLDDVSMVFTDEVVVD